MSKELLKNRMFIIKYESSPKELVMIEGFKGPRVQGFKGT